MRTNNGTLKKVSCWDAGTQGRSKHYFIGFSQRLSVTAGNLLFRSVQSPFFMLPLRRGDAGKF
jgi:hypothetical protein